MKISLLIFTFFRYTFKNMRILIVEDEPKVASFIRKGLGESHFEAEIAYDGTSAEKLARQYKYDLFILDIIIPGIGGLDLCKLLKKMHPGVPVLLLTAKEFSLLEYFMRNSGRVLSRKDILERIRLSERVRYRQGQFEFTPAPPIEKSEVIYKKVKLDYY